MSTSSTTKPALSGKGRVWIRPASPPRFSCFPPVSPLKRRGASPTAAAGCSGATRAPSPWATACPTATSSWPWVTRSKSSTKGTGYFPSRSSTSNGTMKTKASTIPTRSPRKSTAIFSRTSRSKANGSRPAPWCPASPFSRPTARPLRATGSTATAIRKRGTWRPEEARRTP